MSDRKFRATTILCVKRDNEITIGGDGQVSQGATICKANGEKIKELSGGKVLVGYAGTVTDAFSLLEILEEKLEKYNDLKRAAYELARSWRVEKHLQKFDCSIIATDKDRIIEIAGEGILIEYDENIAAIGSGSNYAASAAKALIENTSLTSREIVEKSLKIAADTCVYTNHNFIIKSLKS